MYIHRLTLQRFRGARDLSVDLNSHLNVFVGLNGAGKTSILDASAILLSWLANRIKRAGASGRKITRHDIKNGEHATWLELELQLGNDRKCWSRNGLKTGYQQQGRGSNLKDASEIATALREKITRTDGATNLPLFAYYPVHRSVLDIPLRIRKKHTFDLLSAYDEALNGGVNFRTFFEWFREREDLENEQTKLSLFSGTEDTGATSPQYDVQLQAVRRAVGAFMPGFDNLRVRRNPLRMEVVKDGQTLIVNQLSDGEKCLMALVGDLARRLAIANPERDNSLHGDGIILIDEIDLHLHPKWQRELIPRLHEVFPNCQFLISTHSPHVITHIPSKCLFMLDMVDGNLQCSKANYTFGQTVERILEDHMGLQTTRPTTINDELNAIFSMIEDHQREDAQSAINKLKEQIGPDPQLLKAEILIQRQEWIGK